MYKILYFGTPLLYCVAGQCNIGVELLCFDPLLLRISKTVLTLPNLNRASITTMANSKS